jgi:diaminopimelate decarboxylase
MEAFRYRAGELYCEQVPLRRLAERYGVPLYVYSQGHIVGQLRQLDAAFRGLNHLICFGMKANSNLATIRTVAKTGAGFDIVSGGELFRVVRAGGDPRKCVFSGVGKTHEEIQYALAYIALTSRANRSCARLPTWLAAWDGVRRLRCE